MLVHSVPCPPDSPQYTQKFVCSLLFLLQYFAQVQRSLTFLFLTYAMLDRDYRSSKSFEGTQFAQESFSGSQDVNFSGITVFPLLLCCPSPTPLFFIPEVTGSQGNVLLFMPAVLVLLLLLKDLLHHCSLLLSQFPLVYL